MPDSKAVSVLRKVPIHFYKTSPESQNNLPFPLPGYGYLRYCIQGFPNQMPAHATLYLSRSDYPDSVIHIQSSDSAPGYSSPRLVLPEKESLLFAFHAVLGESLNVSEVYSFHIHSFRKEQGIPRPPHAKKHDLAPSFFLLDKQNTNH